MKKLQILPDFLYGQSNACKGDIEVNVEYIWNLTKNEDKFVSVFAQTYAHELVHILIENIFLDIFQCGEERIIRDMLREEWDQKLSKTYTCRKFKKI